MVSIFLRVISVVALAVLILAAGKVMFPVHARGALLPTCYSAEQCHQDAWNVSVEPGQVLSVPVHPRKSVIVIFPEPLEAAVPDPANLATMRGVGERLIVEPLPKSPLGAETTIDVTTYSRKTRLIFRNVDNAEDVRSTVYLRGRPRALEASAWLGYSWKPEAKTQ